MSNSTPPQPIAATITCFQPPRFYPRSGWLFGGATRRQFEPASVAGWACAVCCDVAWSFDAEVPNSQASAGATIAARPQPSTSPISFARMLPLHLAPRASLPAGRQRAKRSGGPRRSLFAESAPICPGRARQTRFSALGCDNTSRSRYSTHAANTFVPKPHFGFKLSLAPIDRGTRSLHRTRGDCALQAPIGRTRDDQHRHI